MGAPISTVCESKLRKFREFEFILRFVIWQCINKNKDVASDYIPQRLSLKEVKTFDIYVIQKRKTVIKSQKKTIVFTRANEKGKNTMGGAEVNIPIRRGGAYILRYVQKYPNPPFSKTGKLCNF